MKLIKKTMIFLAVLLVGLLAVSSVSASDMVNETNDLLNYENNNEITEVVDDSVISIEFDNNMSVDTEFDRIGNCLDTEISIADRNLENGTDDVLQSNDVKIVANPVEGSNYYFKVLDCNNNPIPDTYFSYKYLSHSGGAHTDSNGRGYIFLSIPWDLGSGKYPLEISSNGVTVTTYIDVSSNEVYYVDYNHVATYKKTNYFKVELTYVHGYKPVKNLKLALKIYTGKKYKTYYITTNNKGIAKFNTKNLKIGSHKYIVTSTNKKYNLKEYGDPTGTITIKKVTKNSIKKTTTTKKTTTKKKSNTKTVTKGKFKATFSLSTWNIAKKSPGMWDKQVKNTGIKKYNGKTVKAYLSTYGKKIRISWSAGGRQLAIKNIGTTIR